MRFLAGYLLLFFANAENVRDITRIQSRLLARLVIIAFVKAQMLWTICTGFRTLHHDCVESACQQT
jgi:hypothetical protein